MDNKANKCPKCQKYILGDFCYECKINIYEYDFLKNIDTNDNPLKDIFDQFKKE